MPDISSVLKAIDKITEAQEIQTTGILKCIEANAIVTNNELVSIKDHLAKINGTIVDLQKESDARKQAVIDFRQHQKFGKWVHKNWWLVTLLFFVSVALVVLILDTIGLRGLWEELKDLK